MLRRRGRIGGGLRGGVLEIDAGLGFWSAVDLLLLDIVLLSNWFFFFSFCGGGAGGGGGYIFQSI